MSDAYEKIRASYAALHRYLGEGRNRVVYQVSPEAVVKIPLNDYGMDDNSREAIWSQRYGKGGYVPYAQCQIIWDTELPLLRMELVTPCGVPWSELPSWCMSVDCCQVGYDLQGKLVAYDFG
jgi:hypothetical protein